MMNYWKSYENIRKRENKSCLLLVVHNSAEPKLNRRASQVQLFIYFSFPSQTKLKPWRFPNIGVSIGR